MYCRNCGVELNDGVKFCPKCGTAVFAESSSASASTDEPIQAVKERRTVGDTATDFIASKITGQQVRTTDISLEKMTSLITEHCIQCASTDKERKKLRRFLKGELLGHLSKGMDSADGKYSLRISATYVPGFQLLQLRFSNWITIQEVGTGNVYQYKAFSWSKFKKATTAEMDKYWK